MKRKTMPSNIFISRKQLKYNTAASTFKGFGNTAERLLSELIQVESNSLNHLQNINNIYDLLIQIKSFQNYLKINDLNKDIILNILNSGVLKLFQLDEKVYKKGTYPQFYFLVLVGSVSFLNNKKVYNPGSFFGEEILREIQYKHTAFASERDTILLLIPKEYFILYLKDNIIKTNEKIEEKLINSFHIFKTFDNVIFHKYKDKMIKIYPETGQMIISKQDKADAIYIIFKGNCVLNIEEFQDLIILEDGDIFGIESLENFDEERNITDNNYLYNIINKSPNTIIFKFFINDLNQIMIKSIKNQLSDYFNERKTIINKHENLKENIQNKLMDKYNFFQQKKNKRKLLSQSVYKEFSNEKTEKFYYKALNNIRFHEKDINDKQKLIPKQNIFFHKNGNDRFNLLRKIIKSNSFIKSRESLLNRTRKKIMSNLLLKKDIKEIKKLILNSDLKKILNNNKKEEGNKENDKKIEINPNKNKKNEKNIFYNSSNQTINILDNSANNSLFFTSINYNPNKNNVYKTINILSARDSKKIQKKKIKHGKREENLKNKEEGSKTVMGSTCRDSYSYRNKSQIISARKQIEDYGFTVLDSMNYFNYGEKSNSMNSSYYGNNPEKPNIKKCVFYETNKFNIPLFILLDEKEKINFPQLYNL